MCILLNSVPSTGKHLINMKLKELGWSTRDPMGNLKVFRPGGSYGCATRSPSPAPPGKLEGLMAIAAASPGCRKHPKEGAANDPRRLSGKLAIEDSLRDFLGTCPHQHLPSGQPCLPLGSEPPSEQLSAVPASCKAL